MVSNSTRYGIFFTSLFGYVDEYGEKKYLHEGYVQMFSVCAQLFIDHDAHTHTVFYKRFPFSDENNFYM